jgi:hypothetical protein
MAKRWLFTYMFCNDLQMMKWFYQEILHLELIWESDRSIAFRIEDHQISIDYHKDHYPFSSNYAIQPGWEGGTEPRISWSLECDRTDFEEIIQSAKNSDVSSFFSKPEWKGYWSFPILDPMNNTIEITCTEADWSPNP